MKKLPYNQRGVVSFFTVIFVSTLLLVITTASIKLMINSQRLSTDYDLSTRAYYAAEAGVDDALVAIRNNIDEETGELDISALQTGLGRSDLESCGGERDLTDSTDPTKISYTCMFISQSYDAHDPNSVKDGNLKKGQATNIDLHGAEGVARVQLSWHQKGVPPQGDGAATDRRAPGNNTSNWTGVPAIMRLQTIQYPTTSSFLSNDINNYVTFAYPNNSGGSISINDSNGSGSCNYAPSLANDAFVCTATFTNFDTDKFKFLRLRAINRGAHFQLRLLDAAGNPIAIPNQIVVDVTGRAGDVSRRIRVKASITSKATGGGGSNDFDINHTLLVDEDICKQIEVDPSTNAVSDNFCPTSP